MSNIHSYALVEHAAKLHGVTSTDIRRWIAMGLLKVVPWHFGKPLVKLKDVAKIVKDRPARGRPMGAKNKKGGVE